MKKVADNGISDFFVFVEIDLFARFDPILDANPLTRYNIFMGKFSNFIIGAVIGVVGGVVVNYLFGPTDDAPDDGTFQSRLDYALEQGRKAAEEKEAELRRDFDQNKGLPG